LLRWPFFFALFDDFNAVALVVTIGGCRKDSQPIGPKQNAVGDQHWMLSIDWALIRIGLKAKQASRIRQR